MAEIAALIGPLIGGIGTLAGMSSAQESAMVQLMNLQFQKRMADEQMQMAQAGRTDAYGNQMVYDRASNTWKTILTPTQKGIVSAGEQEQLKRLTEDATRNRQIEEEQRQRGFQAMPDYAKAVAGFRYDEPASQPAMADKLQTLLSLSNQDQTRGDAQAVGRTLLRQGRGADLPIIMKAADDAQGQNLGKNLAQGYQASIPQHIQAVQAHQSQYLPVLKQLQETMAGGGSAPPTFSTTPQELNAIQGQQLSGALSALHSGASGVGSAYAGLAKSIGDTAPDLKGLASVISAFRQNKGNQPQYGIVPNGSDNSGGGSGFDTSDYSSFDHPYVDQYNDYFG